MSYPATTPFPAVLIGGPLHSGKSVLTYSLTQMLREQHVDHYVLRACPDGEGDFSNEAHPDRVNMIRQKGKFDTLFVERVCQGLQKRHFPLLVDVGGKPTPEQERIFTHCTHAILIASDPAKLAVWRAMIERINAAAGCRIEIIAELHSQLDQPDQLGATTALLGATIGGLHRGHRVNGLVCTALVEQLRQLFQPSLALQRQAHLASPPCEIVAEVDRIGRSMGRNPDTNRWQVEELPPFLDYLPAQTELALYGRAPNWLYCAAAVHAQPAPFHLFDARLGWVVPVAVTLTGSPTVAAGTWQTLDTQDAVTVHWQLGQHYLDYEELHSTEAPTVDHRKGVILSCRGPLWLQTALAIAYAGHNLWVAIYYPNQSVAVVVYSSTPVKTVGEAIPSPTVPANQ